MTVSFRLGSNWDAEPTTCVGITYRARMIAAMSFSWQSLILLKFVHWGPGDPRRAPKHQWLREL